MIKIKFRQTDINTPNDNTDTMKSLMKKQFICKLIIAEPTIALSPDPNSINKKLIFGNVASPEMYIDENNEKYEYSNTITERNNIHPIDGSSNHRHKYDCVCRQCR